jgi:uncharacterized protein (TIGR04222 family)
MSFDRHAFTAAIVSLAVKGQLTIEEHGEDFSLLRSEAPPRVELSPGERAVLEALLPRQGERIEMDNENHKIFGEARSELKKALKKEYRGRLFLLNRIYLLPPMLMSVVAAGVAAFFTGGPAVWIVFALLTIGLHTLFVFLLRAPTPSGRVVMDEIEGFRSYLDTAEQDRLERMQSPRLTPEVFEAFLPYAYALGVENSWCERFAREVPAAQPDQRAYHPSWYRGQFHGIAAVGHLGDSFSASFSSAIASASTPPGSAGGGGGSVGGGGGGGGGGGW